jgi:hypothetical protein
MFDYIERFTISETAAQEAVGMKLAHPGRVADIGFPARYVLGITGVRQNDFESVLFEDLISRIQ